MTALLAIVAIVAIIGLSVILVLYTRSVERQQSSAEARQSAERLRWAEERTLLFDQIRYLNDRFLAKHAGEAIAMDRVLRDTEQEPRQRVPLLPEGL